MPMIWYCPTCNVGVRVPDDAATGQRVYRCPRCRMRITPDGSRPPSETLDVEVVEDVVVVEDEPVEPPRPAPASRSQYVEYTEEPPRPVRRPRRKPKGTPAGALVGVWLIVGGLGLLTVLVVVALVLYLGS